MVNKKDIERISGRIQTKNFSCSLNERLTDPLISIFGGGTEILRKFFMIRTGLKDDWDLENLMTEKLFEVAGMSKKDKLTKELEKTMSDYIINFYEEKLKSTEINENEKETIKIWIKDAKRVKEEYEKKKS